MSDVLFLSGFFVRLDGYSSYSVRHLIPSGVPTSIDSARR